MQQRRAEAVYGITPDEQAALSVDIAGDDIFRDGEMRKKIQLLKDDADAVPLCIQRIS